MKAVEILGLVIVGIALTYICFYAFILSLDGEPVPKIKISFKSILTNIMEKLAVKK